MNYWIKNIIKDSFPSESDVELILELIEIVQSGINSSEIDRALRKAVEEDIK